MSSSSSNRHSSSSDRSHRRHRSDRSRSPNDHDRSHHHGDSSSGSGSRKRDKKLISKESGHEASSSSAKSSAHVTGVHSFNAWEDVEMDADKKDKFLRLMGASKADSHTSSSKDSKFHIGDASSTHTKAGEHSKEMDEKLETQYKSSMDIRTTKPRHAGFGFNEPAASSTSSSAGASSTTTIGSVDTDGCTSTTAASTVETDSKPSGSKNYLSMFVKSSTS